MTEVPKVEVPKVEPFKYSLVLGFKDIYAVMRFFEKIGAAGIPSFMNFLNYTEGLTWKWV